MSLTTLKIYKKIALKYNTTAVMLPFASRHDKHDVVMCISNRHNKSNSETARQQTTWNNAAETVSHNYSLPSHSIWLSYVNLLHLLQSCFPSLNPDL